MIANKKNHQNSPNDRYVNNLKPTSTISNAPIPHRQL